METRLPLLEGSEIETARPATGDRAEDEGFGALRTERGHLPLAAMDVVADVRGLVAATTVRQTFVNVLGEALEATYIFPLPERAAVTAFRMKVGSRTVEGILKERGQARREYDEAIAAGHRAAITEEERPGVFTMRVGNIPAGEKAMVEISMAGPLPWADGEATFRFPLVVAPRYIPGVPLPDDPVGDGVAGDTDLVPDASRISPPVLLRGFPNPVRLSIEVELSAGGLEVRDIRSSLHAVVEEGRPDGSRRIRIQPGERLDRDFLLRFRTAGDGVRAALVCEPDPSPEGSAAPAGAAEGTFSLTVLPPVATGASRPRDVAFVLDRSGSMSGWKMVAARRAMARMLDTLGDSDRFCVLAFDDRIEEAPGTEGPTLIAATNRSRFRAVEFLAGIDSRGGTEMAAPIEKAVDILSRDAGVRDAILVLVTDGQVGNEDHILRRLGGRLDRIRVFTLGVDRAVNQGFLDRLARAGGGSSELVESEDRLDEVMDRVHRHIATPVLTDLELEAHGLAIDRDSVAPARLPALFEGAPVTVLGRYRGAASGAITLRARDRAGAPWSTTLPAAGAAGLSARVVWARGRVRDLEDAYASARGAQQDLERTIVETSLRFGVLSRFTAFLAVDVAETVNPDGKVHRVVQPVEMPQGWAMPLQDMVGCGAPARQPTRMKLASRLSAEVFLRRVDDTAITASPPESALVDGMTRAARSLLPHEKEPETVRRAPGDSECLGRLREILDRLSNYAADRYEDREAIEALVRKLRSLLSAVSTLLVRLGLAGVSVEARDRLERISRQIERKLRLGLADGAAARKLCEEAAREIRAWADDPEGKAPSSRKRRREGGFWK